MTVEADLQAMNFLIVGYPKSGNTWINFLLAYYCNAKYIDAPQEEQYLMGKRDVESLKYKRIPELQGQNEHENSPDQVDWIIKSHLLPDDMLRQYPRTMKTVQYSKENPCSEPLLTIVRHPGDVVVSYFYYTFHRGSYRNNPWTRHLPYFLKDKYFKWRYFEEFAYKTGKEWSEFVFETLRLDPLVIRYEDLHIDPLAELRRVATRFDLPFHKEIAERAVGFCDFSRWQQRERQASDTAKKNGERFFRSGETGQWKEHFSDKMLNRFSDIVQPVASKLGYELHL